MLEALYAGSPRIAGVLAEHFARGRRPLQAASYALEAARLEASQSAWAMVEHWCRLGLKWLEAIEGQEAAQTRLDLSYELAQGYYRNGDYHSATETFQKAIDQAQLANADPHLVARLWVYLSEGEEAQERLPLRQACIKQGQDSYAKTSPTSKRGHPLVVYNGRVCCLAEQTRVSEPFRCCKRSSKTVRVCRRGSFPISCA